MTDDEFYGTSVRTTAKPINTTNTTIVTCLIIITVILTFAFGGRVMDAVGPAWVYTNTDRTEWSFCTSFPTHQQAECRSTHNAHIRFKSLFR